MKKVIYICSRPPFPVSAGREYMIAQSLKFLAESAELHVICFHSDNEDVAVQPILDLGAESVTNISLNGLIQTLISFIFNPSKPFQQSLYRSPRIKRKIEYILNEMQADVIVFDMLRTAHLSELCSSSFVVDYDDLLSARYAMMMSNSGYSVLGTYEDRLPGFVSYLEPLLRRFLLGHECRAILKEEARYFTKADGILFTSPKEAREANSLYKSTKAVGVSQAYSVVDVLDFDSLSSSMLFVGNMRTAQNLASLKFIVDEVLPELPERFILSVVGGYDERAVNIADGNPMVKLNGFVDDIYSVAENCFCALMPVAFGTGVKTKVLDAMACGIPVVTNSTGAEGLGVIDGENILVANDSSEISLKVLSLYNDVSARIDLGLAGRNYVFSEHSYDRLKKTYLDVVLGRSS